MKPTLKAPRAKRLKLKYDEPLSDFAFNFNLRCYTTAEARGVADQVRAELKVRRCRLTLLNPR
jgi:hypothetical protein